MKPGGRVRGPGLPGPTAWRPVRNDALLSQWSGAPGLRQRQRNPPKALGRQFQVVRVEVHPYAAPAQPLGHGAGGTRADEGVQYQPARRTTGQDAGFHQCFGEGGVMGSRVILGSDGLHLRPHRDRGENGRRGLFPGRPTPDLPAREKGESTTPYRPTTTLSSTSRTPWTPRGSGPPPELPFSSQSLGPAAS